MQYVLTFHRQRNPIHGAIVLGFNTLARFNLANFGCLLCCLAALCGVTPAELNRIGIAAGPGVLFAAGSGIALTYDVVKWVAATPWRFWRATIKYKDKAFPLAEYQRLIDHLRAGGKAILEVQWPVTRAQHFVLAIGVVDTDAGVKILIADPERQGQVETLDVFYGKWPEALVQAAYYVNADLEDLLDGPMGAREIANEAPGQHPVCAARARKPGAAKATESVPSVWDVSQPSSSTGVISYSGPANWTEVTR